MNVKERRSWFVVKLPRFETPAMEGRTQIWRRIVGLSIKASRRRTKVELPAQRVPRLLTKEAFIRVA